MLATNFTLYDHNFCEASIYTNNLSSFQPEYLNTISSLYISFIGINSIIKPHLNHLVLVTYSLLALNGLLSFLYHYYNSIGFGLLDRISMILLSFNTTIMYCNIFCSSLYQVNYYKYIIYIFIAFYFSIFLTITGLYMEDLFNILFGIFLISLILYNILFEYLTSFNIPRKILNLSWKGIKYIAFSAIFWVLTESLCYKFFIIKFLFGHVWWHIFVSLGGYYISIIPNYLHIQNNIKNKNKLNNTINIIIKKDKFGIEYLDYEYLDNEYLDTIVSN